MVEIQVIRIQKVVLTFPPTPDVRQEMRDALQYLTDHYSVRCEADRENRTLTIAASPERPNLGEIFSPIKVAKLIKGGLEVKICYCPEGTTAVALTFPEEGWDRRDPQILRGVYHAEGYKTKMDSEKRRLVLESRTASLDDLPFQSFVRKGYKVEFIQ